MSTFRKSAAPKTPGTPEGRDPQGAADAQSSDLSSLFNYPSLGRLLEGTDRQALEEMRARLTRTGQELERVIRQGTKEDAARAERAARGVSVTLSLLATLDGMRGEGGGAK